MEVQARRPTLLTCSAGSRVIAAVQRWLETISSTLCAQHQPVHFSHHLLPTCCQAMDDIFELLEGAHHLIYIYSWSFGPEEMASPPDGRGPVLGEILKRKADEGGRQRLVSEDAFRHRVPNEAIVASYLEAGIGAQHAAGAGAV